MTKLAAYAAGLHVTPEKKMEGKAKVVIPSFIGRNAVVTSFRHLIISAGTVRRQGVFVRSTTVHLLFNKLRPITNRYCFYLFWR